MRSVILALVLACQAPLATQEPAKPPELPPPPTSSAPPKAPDPFAALVPGALPSAATTDVRAAWDAMCAASAVPGPRAEPVRAFALTVDVRYRGTARGSNDVLAEFRFLAPSFVRVKLVEGKREVGRGPDGDWLDDASRKERIRLTVGRQYEEDRRQLDQWQAIAKDFVALTDPKSLRIARIETLPAAPTSLPATVAKRGAELRWIRLASPDFRLVNVPPEPRLFRVSLGRDPKTGWVELALIEEDLPGTELRPSATLLELKTPKPLDAFVVPQNILVHAIEGARRPAAFTDVAGMDLFVRIPGSSLRATLAAADFQLR